MTGPASNAVRQAPASRRFHLLARVLLARVTWASLKMLLQLFFEASP